MLLHKECLIPQLQQNAEQLVIAAVFNDCNGDALTPGTQLAKCSDIPAAPAPQVLSINGNTVSLSGGGGSVTVPDQDTDAQQLSISGNVVSLTNGGSITLPTTAAPVPQVLSIAGNTVSLSGGGGSVTVPDNDAQTLDLQGNTLTISGGNSVTLPAGATPVFATPAEAQAGTSTTLHINPADLYARENIAAQTGVSNDVTAIPAPTAGQSPWAVNQLGETLHYAPGLGWKIVSDRFTVQQTASGVVLTPSTWAVAGSYTAARTGNVVVTYLGQVASTNYTSQSNAIFINGSLYSYDNNDQAGPSNDIVPTANTAYSYKSTNSSVSWSGKVNTGDIITGESISIAYSGTIVDARFTVTYTD